MRSEKTSFRVTRHLPDGGAGLQYRIKGERDGIERVVTESSIESSGENFSFSPPNSAISGKGVFLAATITTEPSRGDER
jgi:hypothetical protein